MFLEIDEIAPTQTHPVFRPAFEFYHADQPVEAMNAAFKAVRQMPDNDTPSATDWLLLGNLAQICGVSQRCRAAYKMGHRAFPNDWPLAAVYTWELSARGKSSQCMRLIKQALKANPDQKAIFHALASYNHSLNGWKTTANKFHASAQALAAEDAVVLYILSRAAGRRTDWQQAIELGEKVVALQPNWARAKAALFDSLLCTGQNEKAGKLIDLAANDRRHVWVDFSKSTFLEINQQYDAAIEHLDKVVNYYPKNSRMTKFSVRQMILLLMRSKQVERARELTQSFSIKGFEDWEKSLTDDQRKAYISVPLIAQATNHCVPTVAAMVGMAQGHPVTAQELAEKMQTRHGTPLWKMVDTMREEGFLARCVKPTPEIVEKMLEQNVPLIGELSGVLSGHVDVVCGFDSGLKMIYLRDPMHWYGYSTSYEALEKRYETSCSLWALIAPDQIANTRIEDDWINSAAEALIDMSRAIALGNRLEAEEAFARIPDDHPLSFARDCTARFVVLTERQTETRIDKEINSIQPDAELTLPQIRSMLATIDDQNAARIYKLAKANVKRLGPAWVDYVRTQGLLAKMKWREAEQQLIALSKKWPGMESVWSQLGRVKTELGKSEEAQRCFDIASEIAPERDYFQTQNIDRLKHKISFAEQLEQTKAVAVGFPWTPEINISMAILLSDSDDGLAYERSLKRCIKFFPRNPWGYHQLSGWYLIQERTDLAKRVMRVGRKLIGDDELPVADFELSESERLAREEESAEANKQSSEKGNVFQRHYALLVKKARSADFATFQALDELAAVKTADRKHAFTWVQSAELLALEIANLLGDTSETMLHNVAAKQKKLAKLLPEKPAGIGEQFAEYVLEAVNLDLAGPQVVKQMLTWVQKVAPNSKLYPNLEFQRAFLLESLSKYNEAEEMLNQIIRNHPAYVSAWYRVGQLHSQRNELPRAWETFEKCLEIQPGNFGAISELARLAPMVKPERASEFAEKFCRRFPYSQRYIYEAAVAKVEGEDVTEAVMYLNSHKKQLGESKHATSEARLFADTGDGQRALESLEAATIDKEDAYAANWVRVDVYVQQEKFKLAAKWLDELEKDFPDDESVIDQKARLLRLDDPAKAKKYAEDQILAGQPQAILAHVTMDGEKDAFGYAKKMLQRVDAKYRDATANAFYDAINYSDDSKAALKFLEHCHETLPHMTEMSETLVYRLGTSNKIKRSIAVAKTLHEADPENPKWMSLLGWAVQDHDPKQSIKLLKREFELTDSVETLSRLGRGYQLSGDDQLAKATYEKVLHRNPNHTLAMCNLMFKYGCDDRAMLNRVVDTIEKGMVHGSDQYFLVQAVKLAKQHKVHLPSQWISLAIDRLEQMADEMPFRDEKKMLTRAVYAWAKHWSVPIPSLGIGIADKLMAQFSWPKKEWIPEKET